MTAADPPVPPAGAEHCSACGGPLAHDQRYCVRCGARRGTLPLRIGAAVRELAGRAGSPHRDLDTRGADQVDPTDPANPTLPPAGGPDFAILPLARAATVSILLMLGLGAVFGAALRPGGVASLAREVVVVMHHPAAASTPSQSIGSGGAASGSRAGPVAITETVTQTVGSRATPPVATGSGGGSGPASRSGSGSSSGSGSGRGAGSGSSSGSPSRSVLPPIGHVWEIVLSGQGYAQSFGAATGHPYLSRLVDQGELITQYDAVAGSPLANEVALVSGQGPTPQTLSDCPTYSDITPGTTGTLGQVLGSGCLYPASTETLGQQLQIAGMSWRAYIQGLGARARRPAGTTTTQTTPGATTTTSSSAPPAPTTASTPATSPPGGPTALLAPHGAPATATTPTTPAPGRETSTAPSTTTAGSSPVTPPLADTSTAAGCAHPAQNAPDTAQAASSTRDYVTWKNPWVYFHSTVDARAACAKDDVGLTRLARDLRSDRTTPSFSYIAPDPCDDGSLKPCLPGAADGLHPADAFLRTVVPLIERSAAYRADGLILITFDVAPQSGPNWSTGSCCGQPTFPNLPPAAGASTTPTGTTTAAPTAAPVPGSTTPTPAPPATTPAGTATSGASPPASGGCPPATSTSTSTTTMRTTTTAPSTTCAPAIAGDPPGGGQVGLLMISPYVRPHTLNTIETYNHFSLLKSIENLFGLPHLGYAAATQVPAFSPSLFLAHKR